MAVTAAFVAVATIIAERSGPLIGGLITTLPISAGPVYVFLALDHDTRFLADTALGSLAINPAIAVYALAYVLLSQGHDRLFSIGIAFLLWLVLAPIIHEFSWTLVAAILFNAAVLPHALSLRGHCVMSRSREYLCAGLILRYARWRSPCLWRLSLR